MDTEKIIQELERRFAAPLPEFYKRRIIVWHDEDREFEDGLSEIVLTNAKVVALTGTNFFSAKKLLGVDDTSSNYLVYSPIAYESLEDNWLLEDDLRVRVSPQIDNDADEHPCHTCGASAVDHGRTGGAAGSKA